MGEALLKVLLVDDEPFILQGLKILIDWEQEGFEVVKTAANRHIFCGNISCLIFYR